MLDSSEADLRPFRLGRDAGGTPTVDLPSALPRDRAPDAWNAAEPLAPTFPQPRQPGQAPTDPMKGTLPELATPILPPDLHHHPTKKGGGGS